MLYFVGGAARTGKTIIAHRFMQDTGISCFSLDILMMGLANGLPDYGINPEDPDFVNAGKMWPVVRSMSRNIIEAELEYIIEGITILPEHINELVNSCPGDIKACFIGYTSISPERKLEAIRGYPDFPNNWSKGYTDQQLLELINRMIKYSAYLQEECFKYEIPYFDQSEDFTGIIDMVVNYLKEP